MSELKVYAPYDYSHEPDKYPSLVYDKSEADAVIAEKDKVISEKDEEIRRLHRALYKACSNWACAKMEYEQFDSNMFMCGVITDKEVSWESMMKKCLKKAEEFKEEK